MSVCEREREGSVRKREFAMLKVSFIGRTKDNHVKGRSGRRDKRESSGVMEREEKGERVEGTAVENKRLSVEKKKNNSF